MENNIEFFYTVGIIINSYYFRALLYTGLARIWYIISLFYVDFKYFTLTNLVNNNINAI